MPEKNRNTTGKPEEFLSYRRKRMMAKEMNDFERHLQKDPFSAEAAEGFENIDPDQAERDLLLLQKKIRKKTTGNRIPWYGIAASFAVLMIIISVLFVVNKNEPVDIAFAPPVQNRVEENLPDAGKKMVPPAGVTPPEISERTPEKTAKEVVRQKEEAEAEVSDEIISADNIKDEVKPLEALKMAEEPSPVLIKGKAVSLRNAIVNEAPADTSPEFMPAGVSALDEIVIVGYGAAGKNDNEDENIHTPAEPVNGMKEFDRYIRENIRRPDTITSGQRVVVVLDFIVRNNGIIDSIKVVRSPGSNFADEAIRLLKEGPEWKPAMENGSAITDNVRLRIVFR